MLSSSLGDGLCTHSSYDRSKSAVFKGLFLDRPSLLLPDIRALVTDIKAVYSPWIRDDRTGDRRRASNPVYKLDRA